MRNGYNILWTQNALNELDNTIDYLKLNFSDKEVKRLLRKIDDTIELIQINPDMFLKSDSSNIYKVVILKYNTMYYQVINENIEILSFFPNRQAPKNLLKP